MKKEFFISAKFKLGIYSLGSILTLAGIIILVNFLSFYIFKRIDLTAGGIYSLSKASIQIIRSLDDPVLIKCFFTRNLPIPYNTQGKYVRDLLIEYRNLSRGKVKFEFMDPSEDKEIKKEAQMTGIQPLTFTQVANDKYEMKEGFMGLVFLYEDKKEIVPFVKDVSSLEYDITSHIKKITQPSIKSVGFLQAYGAQDLFGDDYSNMRSFISKNYDLKAVSIQSDKLVIPEDISSLLVIGPKDRIPERDFYQIDQFIMKGKPVAFLVDNADIDLQSFAGTPLNSNIPEYLEAYGIRVNKGFVLDLQNQIIGVTTNRGMFSMQEIVHYPLLPIVTEFKKDNPVVKDLQKITFPFISPVEILNDKANIEVLAQSSKNSWDKDNTLYFSPMQKYLAGKDDKKGPFNLVVAEQGKLNSYFASKTDSELKTLDKTYSSDNTLKESSPVRIMVAGNSRFMQPRYADPSNAAFFLNIIDWVAQDSTLISIRGKSSSMIYRPLKEVSKMTRFIVKWGNVFLMPVLFILYGVFRWRIRQAFKKKIVL